MNITADTTDEQILAPIDVAKQVLLDLATKAMTVQDLTGDRLVGYAQNVASAEVLASARIQYRNVCRHTPERRTDFLFDLISRGADDEWSGRKNDSKRSSFDAVRGWAANQMMSLRYGN